MFHAEPADAACLFPVATALIMSEHSEARQGCWHRPSSALLMGEPRPMAMTTDYLALDLGAESGRGLLGRFDGSQLALEEIHRFPNGPVKMLDTIYWDLPRLFGEIKSALGKAAATAAVSG